MLLPVYEEVEEAAKTAASSFMKKFMMLKIT